MLRLYIVRHELVSESTMNIFLYYPSILGFNFLLLTSISARALLRVFILSKVHRLVDFIHYYCHILLHCWFS